MVAVPPPHAASDACAGTDGRGVWGCWGEGGLGARPSLPLPGRDPLDGGVSPKILSERSGDALEVLSFPRGAPCPGRAATQGDDEEPVAAHRYDLLFRFGF